MDVGRGMPNLLVPAIIGGFIVIGLLMVYLLGPVYGWIVMIGVMCGCMLIGSPKTLLLIYACWITVNQYMLRLAPSIFTVWADEMLTAVMLIVLFSHHIRSRIYLPELWPVKRALLWLLGLIIVSKVINQVPVRLVFHYLLQYMRFFLVFYYTYYFLSERDLKTVLRVFVVLYITQVVIDVTWYLGINPMLNWTTGVDFSIGTGLGANVVAYFSVAFICLMVAYMDGAKSIIQRVVALVAILLALFQLYLTFTFHAFFLLAGCLVLQELTSPKDRHLKLLLFARSAFALLIIVALIMAGPLSYYVKTYFEPQYLEMRWFNMIHGPKGQSYVSNVTDLPKELVFPPVGGGPGNVGSMVGRMNRRPLADRYFNWVDLSVERRNLSEGGSITGGPMTGILALWSELGPLGVLFYWGIQIYAAVRVMKQVHRNLYVNRYQRVLAQAFGPTLAMMILLNVIADYSYLVFLTSNLWIWAACVWKPVGGQPAKEAPARNGDLDIEIVSAPRTGVRRIAG